MRDVKSPIPLFIPIIVGIIAISFSPILVRWSHAPASVQAMYRLLITVLLMLPFGGRYFGTMKSISRKNWLLLLVAGFFLALHFLLWMSSLLYTTVASSTILMALEPMFVMVGAFFLFKERTTPFAIAAMGVAIIGAVLIGWGDIGVSAENVYGDVLSILGTLAMAFNMLAAQQLLTRISSYVYSLLVFIIAGAFFAVYNFLMGIPMFNYPLEEWGVFLLLAIVPTVFGHILFNWLLQFTNGTTISMCVLGEPIGASILAAALFGEMLSFSQMTGGVFVVVGLYLFLRTNRVSYEVNSSTA
ncbi:DMT family transporter [Brevibacillus fluminis]|uniref:DMT family transporter n=1 Tax=Brevibacillus fluminis TaxID=511487 RepID=A0A3M8DSV5_9BACL|nr:DMT family transporter [Brevibacillus fluminis]RNB90461.1 DMT family transporter [Brevibacillus fluminis]